MSNKDIDFNNFYENEYSRFKKHIQDGWSIDDISKYYFIPAYDIIHVLLKYDDDENIIKATNEFYNSYKINDNKCLVIADTHIGIEGKDGVENIGFIYNAYNYALRNNIKNVIHLGDLFEGKSNDNIKSFDINKQIELFKELYDALGDINTLLLLGNHDYNLIFYNKYPLEGELLKQNNVKLIGVQNSYVSFCDTIIKLYHNCHLKNFCWDTKLRFLFLLTGHYHRFLFEDYSNFIQAPAVKKNEYDSGFIELINEENDILFNLFDNQANKVNDKPYQKSKHLIQKK